jgi:hypothetical protein
LFISIIGLNKLKLYDLKDLNKELINKEAIRAKFKLLRPLSQVYNIIVYIRKSSAYTDYFKKLAKKIILIDNRTQ